MNYLKKVNSLVSVQYWKMMDCLRGPEGTSYLAIDLYRKV